MKRTGLIAAMLLALPAVAAAQAPPPPSAQAPATGEVERQHVKMMEGVLTAAVRAGAESLGRQMQMSEPGSLIVTGTARARGFVLEGYGVFFDVDVPMMKQSVLWSTRMLMRERQREQLRAAIAQTPDGPARRQLQQMLAQIERSPDSSLYAPMLPTQLPSTATAQTVNESTSAPAPTAAAPAAPGAAPTPAPEPDTRDPNEMYTDAVKGALIDAMLNYSAPMNIKPDEWLTVAARDSEGPLNPGELYDASTLVLRVKGSDLLAYVKREISRDEARKRVQVKEF